MTIGGKIALIRNEKDWTQEQLGNLIGASKDLVGKYERGVVQPPIEVLIKIATVLNVSIDYLAGIAERFPYNRDTVPRELSQLLTKIEKLPKSDVIHIEAVIDAFTVKSQLNK